VVSTTFEMDLSEIEGKNPLSLMVYQLVYQCSSPFFAIKTAILVVLVMIFSWVTQSATNFNADSLKSARGCGSAP
jgi:hypothetical protein